MIKVYLISLTMLLYAPLSDNTMWEEKLCEQLEFEKVAREFYDVMYDKWDLLAFRNLSKSEVRHMECIQLLIKDLNIQNPVKLKGTGEFSHEKMGLLYKDLLQSGNQSVNEALKAGAVLEEKNIRNIKMLLTTCQNEDAKNALNNLYENSKCHLGLMVCLLNNRDVQYNPSILSVNEFLDCEIIQGLNKQKDLDCPFKDYDCPFRDQIN